MSALPELSESCAELVTMAVDWVKLELDLGEFDPRGVLIALNRRLGYVDAAWPYPPD